VLGLLGIPHMLTGMIIEIPGQRLLVEEACSGINSVLSMTSACVFYAMWQRRSLFFLIVLYALHPSPACLSEIWCALPREHGFYSTFISIFLQAGSMRRFGLVLTGTYLIFIILADALLAKIFVRKLLQRDMVHPAVAGSHCWRAGFSEAACALSP
jgi:hypothetical protein